MPKLKILFADDHIPDERISTHNLEAEIRAERPDLSQPNVDACRPMRHTVEKLKHVDGFDITVANTQAEALRLAQEGGFDIAIVDLGWYLDRAVSPNDQGFAGWKIAETLRESDGERPQGPTAQILYSSRLAEEREYVARAVKENMLPVYKSFDDSGTEALRAAVKYLEARINQERASPQRASAARIGVLHQHLESIDRTALQRLEMWTWLTMVGVGLSLALILVGVGLALTGNAQVGIVTTLSSALVGVVSRLLYGQLKDARDEVKDSRAKLQQEVERLEGAKT